MKNAKRKFYLFGSPIQASPSPKFHNSVFELTNSNVQNEYELYETNDPEVAL